MAGLKERSGGGGIISRYNGKRGYSCASRAAGGLVQRPSFANITSCDAIIAHESEELRRGSHVEALWAAVRTELPISDEARRFCRAMAR